jgi:hypothetical protein
MKQKGFTTFSLMRSIKLCLYERGFTPIVVLTLSALILFIGYIFYSQFMKVDLLPGPLPTPIHSTISTQNNEMANWKTYTNNKYHFSLETPKNWEIFEDENQDQIHLFEKQDPIRGGSLHIKVISNTKSLSTSEYFNEVVLPYQKQLTKELEKDNIMVFDFKNYKVTPLSIPNTDAIQVDGFLSVASGGSYSVYFIANDQIIVEITGKPQHKGQEQIEILSKQIVETFKFTQ